MASKKSPQKAAASVPEKENAVPDIHARIDRMVDYEGSKVKAIASVNIGGAYAVHGIKVMDSEKGLFVSMPSSKYEKDGKVQYSEICHAVTKEAREALNSAVLSAYEEKLEMSEDSSQDMSEAEDESLGQNM